jgi:hypothetical protein
MGGSVLEAAHIPRSISRPTLRSPQRKEHVMSLVDLLKGTSAFQAENASANPACARNVPECPAPEKSSQVDEVGLNEKRLAAIELLALGRSFTLTAKEIGIDRRTLFRWRRDEPFQEQLRLRHRELWGDVNDRLRMLVDPSIEVLCEHLNERYDRNRFRAATAILRFANIGRERKQ